MKKFTVLFFLLILVSSCTGEKAEDVLNESENLKKDSLGLGITNLYGNWNSTTGKTSSLGAKKLVVLNVLQCQNLDGTGGSEPVSGDELPVESSISEGDVNKGAKTTKDWSWGYNWQTGRYDWGYHYNPTTNPSVYNPTIYGRPAGGSSGGEGVALREPYEFCIRVDEDSESAKSYIASETVTTPIGLRISEMDDREDLYLIREVGDKIYLDICECLEKECSDSKISSCYEHFKKLVDSKKEGMFYKDKTLTAGELSVSIPAEETIAPVESND